MEWFLWLLQWGPGVIAAASAAAAVTPTKKDDRALVVVRQVLNLLALNVGNAKPGADK